MYMIQSYRVKPDAFPAYNYARKRALLLHKRFVELGKDLGVDTTVKIKSFDTLDINIIARDDAQNPLDINDVKSNRSMVVETFAEKRFEYIKSVHDYLDTRCGTFSIDLINEISVDADSFVFLSKKIDHVVIIVREDFEGYHLRSYDDCFTATKGKINDDVADILERIVLKEIKLDCDILRPLLENPKKLYCNDRIESLLGEMLALFQTSNVPEDERPKYSIDKDSHSHIDDQLKEDLSRMSPPVKGYGYRFGIFVIHIEETHDRDVIEGIWKQIKSVMEKNCIKPYKVETISKELKLFSRDVGVGAKIKTGDPNNARIGTLGCFAQMHVRDHEKTLCALISKHLATCGKRFYCYESGMEQDHLLGDVVSATVVDTGLDIAAIKLKDDVRFFGRFKPEEPESSTIHLQCKLYDFMEDRMTGILCGGQHVYIWGAVSKPGKGVVTTPDYKTDGMKDGLILVEDRDVKKGEIPERFCKPGDSGAIVCAEDRRGEFVHVIAMLIGTLNDDAMQSDPTTRGKYLTVPLSSGLQELLRRTGCKFELYESIDK